MESTTNKKANENKSESSVFNELISKASNALSKGDLATAELHCSTALKLVSPKQKTKDMRTCFEKLGNIYLEYGKKNGCGEDFAKATALYNAALTRLTSAETKLKEHLICCIKEAERQFLCSIFPKDLPIDLPGYDNDIEHKNVLEKIRDECKETIRQVDFECDPGIVPLDAEERIALEKRRTNLISTLFRKISEDMIRFIQMLIEECTLMLGNAPCRFAVIGLGSLARNEMTPYSDLEFAILLEDGAKTESNLVYFRNITHYLHLKVLNLGETILPSIGITSLNDFYSGDPARMWFFDDGPRGFSFDGAMPWASKSPLGRKKTQTKEAFELIKTPDEMAALQSEQQAIKEGYHLSDVLATSVLITGDEELMNVYNEKVKERLQVPLDEDMWTNGSKRGFECLNKTYEDFSVDIDLNEAGKIFNVKKDLYRLPSLVLNGLALYYDLDSRNTWDAVDEMQRKQLITEGEAQNLSFVLATASELRVRSYLGKNEQREKLTGLPSQTVELDFDESVAAKAGPSAIKMEKIFHVPNPDIIFRFFMTFLPLQKAIEEFLSKKSPNIVKIFSDHDLYDCRPLTKGIIHIRLMEFEKAKICLESEVYVVEEELERGGLGENPDLFETLSSLGGVCLELGEVQQAVEYFDKAAQVLEVKYNGVKTNMEFARSYRDRGCACESLGEYKKSLSFYEKELFVKLADRAVYGEASPSIYIAVSFTNIGRAYQQMKDLEQATHFYERALKITEEIGWIGVGSQYYVILNNLLSVYSQNGDTEKALDTYSNLLEEVTTLFGTGVFHPYLASSLANLAIAYCEAKEYEKAVSVFKQALSMRKRLHGRNEVHPEIAKLRYNLGQCYLGLSDHERAVKYFKKALQIQRFLYAKQISHPDVATTLSSIGSALLEQRILPDALEAYNEALRLLRVIHKDNFAHRDVCAVLNNLGFLHTELSQFDKAASYLEEAKKLWPEICVNGKPHEDYAYCLNMLGNVYRHIGRYKEAYECCRQGLEMRRLLCEGKHSLKSSPLAESFIDIGHCCVSLGDNENALSYFQRGLEMRKALNIDVAAAYSEVGTGYSRLGRPLEAIKYFREAIRLDEEKYGAGNVPDLTLSTNLCNLGGEYVVTSQYEKAAEMLEKALEILNERGVSIELAAALHNLGTVYRNLKNTDKALSYLEKALSVKKQLYGIDTAHLETAKTLTNLGNLSCQLGMFQVAIDYFSESLNMKYALYGPNATHQSIAVTLGNMGNVYYELGQYESAIKYINDALQRFDDAESCSRGVALNLFNLGQAYEGLADLTAAYQCYQKSLQIMVQVFGETHPLVERVLVRWLSIADIAQHQASQANNSG